MAQCQRNPLSEVHDTLDKIEPHELGGEPYWVAKQAISRAGEIVAGNQRASSREAPSDSGHEGAEPENGGRASA